MLKALIWKLNQWLNKIKGEYGDYQFQKREAFMQDVQDMREAYQYLTENLPSVLTKTITGEETIKVAKELREKGTIKGKKTK